MNYEQYEKSLLATPAVSRDTKPPENCIVTEWIECPKSKAVLRYGYNAEKQVLAIMWLNSSGETYLYENVTPWYFDEAKKAYSIGKYLKANMKYKRFTKVVPTV